MWLGSEGRRKGNETRWFEAGRDLLLTFPARPPLIVSREGPAT